jgi:hypothetical protein
MSKTKTLTLSSAEEVIAVVPEMVAGPGWSNAPVWVYIKNHATNELREECIQPEERTREMDTLFRIGWTVHNALLKALPIMKTKNAHQD